MVRARRRTEPAAREAVEYALMEAGALGTGDRDNTVTGYFADVPSRERVRAELFEALRIYELPSSSVRDMSVREIEERDWLEVETELAAGRDWALHHRATVVRHHRSPRSSNRSHRAGDGFRHRHSRDHAPLPRCDSETLFRRSFLDVGTGTGILAIAAAKLSFPKRVSRLAILMKRPSRLRARTPGKWRCGADKLPHRIR